MLRGFRDFILRGNVIELAVAVVIGTAFNNVVTQFANSFVNPLIKYLTGGRDVSGTWTLKDNPGDDADIAMDWGAFLNVVIAFLVTAAVVYFVFVLPMNKLAERRARGEEPESKAPSDEVRLLTEIRDALVAGDGGVGGAPVKPGPVAPSDPRR